MLPNGVDATEGFASLVAVDADVADRDLFTKIADEALEVDEILGIGDEEGVGDGHVSEIVVEGSGLVCAEEAVEGGGAGTGRGDLFLDSLHDLVVRVIFGSVCFFLDSEGGELCLDRLGW